MRWWLRCGAVCSHFRPLPLPFDFKSIRESLRRVNNVLNSFDQSEGIEGFANDTSIIGRRRVCLNEIVAAGDQDHRQICTS